MPADNVHPVIARRKQQRATAAAAQRTLLNLNESQLSIA
jgi:hypothetical protein